MAFPLIALLVAASLAHGGVDGLLSGLDGTIRQTVASVVSFISAWF